MSFDEDMNQWLAMTPAQRERALRGEDVADQGKATGPAMKMRNGGLVRGPGTGTSDSIKAEVPEGSYIMPADSTAKLTPELLAMMTGARSTNPNETARSKPKDIPVNLSNGEYQIPPEQVRNVGAKVLDSIKDATHVPAAAQRAGGDLLLPEAMRPGGGGGARSFADGGRVESTDEMIARIQAKYGTSSSNSNQQQPAQVQRPAAPAPTPAPTLLGAVGALRNRRQQLDEAAGYADGGTVTESTDELIARIQGKYGTGGSARQPQETAAPAAATAAQPVARAVPAPTLAGAATALRNRQQQIDAAAGYADGGTVKNHAQMLLRGTGIDGVPAGGVMKNGRLSFEGGGDVQDPTKPKPIPGSPGVQRVGNEYSATPKPIGEPSPSSADTSIAASPASPARTPTMGQTMNRINNERVERMGGQGMYQPAVKEAGEFIAGAGRALLPKTMAAFSDEAYQGVSDAYEKGGIAAGAGQVARGAMKAMVSPLHDATDHIISGGRALRDNAIIPAAEATATFAKTLGTGDAEPVRIGSGPAVSDVYPDETRRGAATRVPAPAQQQDQQGGPVAPARGDADSRVEYAQMLLPNQRQQYGDAYRNAWQQQARGGLRGADETATATYNAEQLIRGTGITAQRDASGRMSFSGDGTNALPQNYTSGVDLNLANERMARANAIRGETVALQQRMADDANFASGITGARKTTPEERRELAEIQTDRDRRSSTYNQNRLQEEFARARFAGDGRAMENIATQMAMVGKQQSDIREDVRRRESDSDVAEYRRNQLLNTEADSVRRNDVALQQLALQVPDAEGKALANEQARNLQDIYRRILSPKSDEDARAAMKSLQLLQGAGDKGEWKAVALQGGTDERGNRTESVLAAVNERTGEMRRYEGGGTAAATANAPPAVGAVVDGYRFAGGNPADPASWQKVG